MMVFQASVATFVGILISKDTGDKGMCGLFPLILKTCVLFLRVIIMTPKKRTHHHLNIFKLSTKCLV